MWLLLPVFLLLLVDEVIAIFIYEVIYFSMKDSLAFLVGQVTSNSKCFCLSGNV